MMPMPTKRKILVKAAVSANSPPNGKVARTNAGPNVGATAPAAPAAQFVQPSAATAAKRPSPVMPQHRAATIISDHSSSSRSPATSSPLAPTPKAPAKEGRVATSKQKCDPLPPSSSVSPVRSSLRGGGSGEHSRRSIGGDGKDTRDRPESRSTDAVDEVINEASALLQAAAESQSLGRLRNAYSSLLLAHQRLVGLGRRVDRSFCEAEVDAAGVRTDNDDRGEASLTSCHLGAAAPPCHPPLVAQPPLPPALAHGGYSDVAYVEHLARSAMELHHRRTGRGMQHDLALERAAHAARAKRAEEDQLHQAAQGVFALATGGTTTKPGQGDEKNATSSPTKRKGGRGRKPPTLVMHTTAGQNLDVRELMKGVL